MDNIKTIFVDLYGDQLKKPNTTIVECDFDDYFDQQINKLEQSSSAADFRPTESSIHTEEVFVSLEKGGDEPPPLPGFLSRGLTAN